MTREHAAGGFVRSALGTVSASYSQVLFSSNPATAALLLAATASDPLLLAGGLAGAMGASGLAAAAGMPREAVRGGAFGLNGLLVGLALARWFEPSGVLAALLVLSLLAVVVVTAVLRAALGHLLGLPALSLPFVLVAWMALAAAPALGGLEWRTAAAPALWQPALPLAVDGFLRALGSVFFLPDVLPGALVLGALAAASRASAVLAVAGWAVVAAAAPLLGGGAWDPVAGGLGINGILVAVALGGVFFVCGPASTGLAVGGTLLGVLLLAGLQPVLAPAGLPPLILPFNLVVLALLLAARQRVPGRPPVQLAAPGRSPEESLSRHRVRVERFGWNLPLRFSLPFHGPWRVTQGWDGERTHRGPWRHGWDFEVFAAGGERLAPGSDGRRLEDYACYRLPVLAPADGVVARVVDGHPDNPPGTQDTQEVWGNAVVIQHGPALFSVLAHLSPGRIEVREGQRLRRGEPVGVCGSSGRSPVPHLHFQLQAAAVLGAPTLPGELHDIVIEAPRPGHAAVGIPAEGEVVRNLRESPDLARALAWPAGTARVFEVSLDGAAPVRETITAEVELLGDRVLVSAQTGARLACWDEPPVFLTLGFEGSRRSLLVPLSLALSRVPLEERFAHAFGDRIPARPYRHPVIRWLADLLLPLYPGGELAMDHGIDDTDDGLVVRGRGGNGTAVVTEARFDRRDGLVFLEARVGSRHWSARRTDVR
jgi:urea transporter